MRYILRDVLKRQTKLLYATAMLLLMSHLPSFSETPKQSLDALFKEWRVFESPPINHDVPDYSQETFDKRYITFLELKKRLLKHYPLIKKSNPSKVSDDVDWHILLAEMNGFDFNYRVLKPWQRDPAFYKTVWNYKSDVPAHEGPTHHAVVELWQYRFPLSASDEIKLAKELNVIAPLNQQAMKNLTGNARELWIAGIRDIRQQYNVLNYLLSKVSDSNSQVLRTSVKTAMRSTEKFVQWLEAQISKKTGPSGIGKDNYTWYQNNVHLVPLTWDEEVTLLKRELDRAWSSLKLEEHRNRSLPIQKPVTNAQEFRRLAEDSLENFMLFLKDEDIVTVADYFEPELRKHMGEFIPEEKRNFFRIGSHIDPTPLYSHFYHWFELARMEHEPHQNPIRTQALLYNIFDSRSEGLATAVEEIFMHAGLYDDNPRTREIVWIMLAQRAARGLGSLYAHANEMTMEQAGEIHSNWTPRGWMKTEPELLLFEQHLYMRQPGYGTSYVTGKYLVERAMTDYAKMLESQGKPFTLKTFFDTINSIGNIPMSLVHWEMTGNKSDIKRLNLNSSL